MIRTLVFTYTAVGVVAAMAAGNTYRVEIGQESAVVGKTLKTGNYKIELQNNVALIKRGKQTIELPAHSESVAKQYAATEIVYTNNDIQEIHVSGSRIKIVFGAEPTEIAPSFNSKLDPRMVLALTSAPRTVSLWLFVCLPVSKFKSRFSPAVS